MIRRNIAVTMLALLMGPQILCAQSSVEKTLPLDGKITAQGTAIELNWFDAPRSRVGSVSVKRRMFGQTGRDTWQTVASQLGPIMRFTDDSVEPGVAYEYQVLRTARDIVDVGYWIAGQEVPAQEFRGTVHLVVDETVGPVIAPRLNRFERDLAGDGWRVQHHAAPRGFPNNILENVKRALVIKASLRNAYLADPFSQHAVVLVGHVPIVLSGRSNPDGHTAVPHASDLFYAEMDGLWQASPEGLILHNQVPSDFIEMQIGRIDFSMIAGFDRDLELHLLRSYFDKNHHWRQQLLGDLRNAYGQSPHLTVERAGLRNIVGPAAITEGGHHDVGEQVAWLWGVDFGDYNGTRYATDFANRAVFTINFGSNKQKIERGNNAMTALLAQPWYTIATGWGARPAWWLHPMALGGTIGDVHMRTVNNGRASQPYRESMDYYPTGGYLWRNPVWVNLLGDPTTHAFPLAPPAKVRTHVTADGGLQVSWTASPDPDVIGYKVYRAAKGSLAFRPLAAEIIETDRFTDTAPEENADYMVRAYGLKQVYAGSFYTFSQGAFLQKKPYSDTVRNKNMVLTTSSGQPVTLPNAFRADFDGPLHAVIEGPAAGHLSHDGTNWHYTSPTGFTGTIPLRFSVSAGTQTEEGLLTIKISAP